VKQKIKKNEKKTKKRGESKKKSAHERAIPGTRAHSDTHNERDITRFGDMISEGSEEGTARVKSNPWLIYKNNCHLVKKKNGA